MLAVVVRVIRVPRPTELVTRPSISFVPRTIRISLDISLPITRFGPSRHYP